MFLDEKTVLEFGFPGLHLTNFRGTGPTFLIEGTKGRIMGLQRVAQRKRRTSVLGGGGKTF